MRFILVYIAFLVFGLIGWIKCLVHLLSCDFNPIGKAEILYGLGTFTGLGAIIGWFDFGI